jgi:hypothetical protein
MLQRVEATGQKVGALAGPDHLNLQIYSGSEIPISPSHCRYPISSETRAN